MDADWEKKVNESFLSLQETIAKTLSTDTAMNQARMLLEMFKPGLHILHDVVPSDLAHIKTIVALALANDFMIAILTALGPNGVLEKAKVDKVFQLMKSLCKTTICRQEGYSDLANFKRVDFIKFARRFCNKEWQGEIGAGTLLCGICSILRGSSAELDEYENVTTTIFYKLLPDDQADRSPNTHFQSTQKAIASMRSAITSVSKILPHLQEVESRLRITDRGVVHEPQVTEGVKPSLASSSPAGVLQNSESSLEEALSELDSLIGLDGVKDEVRKLISFLKIQRERRKHGLRESGQTLHFVFTGNPGTGKTSVARIVSKIMFGFGILKTTRVAECSRSDLVGGFLGQTAIKTDEKITAALDGVLFIDEAYTLSGDEFGRDMYGQEAIDQLVKRMEDYRDRLVVIVAGYPRPMATFLKSNPGLESRFTRFIRFEDYQVCHLCRIFERFVGIAEYSLAPLGRAMACLLFTLAYNQRDERFGNGRFVRNEFEKALGLHSQRLVTLPDHEISKEALMTLDGPDIPFDSIADFDIATVDLQEAKWEADCPKCGKINRLGVSFLGTEVVCECDTPFIYPWWNIIADTVKGITKDPLSKT
jgi:AAA lid domain/ATPase family associated with various cellular activities (AAA)